MTLFRNCVVKGEFRFVLWHIYYFQYCIKLKLSTMSLHSEDKELSELIEQVTRKISAAAQSTPQDIQENPNKKGTFKSNRGLQKRVPTKYLNRVNDIYITNKTHFMVSFSHFHTVKIIII